MRNHDVSKVVERWSAWCSLQHRVQSPIRREVHTPIMSPFNLRSRLPWAPHPLSDRLGKALLGSAVLCLESFAIASDCCYHCGNQGGIRESRGVFALPATKPFTISQTAARKDSESVDLSSALELQNVRQSLIRQEDTIIFSIIERAQFAANSPVYEPGAVPVPEFSAEGQRYSLLEYILRQTEQLHGRIRRFTSPDEHAFYPEAIPNLVLPPLKYPQVLAPNAKNININADIMAMYLEQLLPAITNANNDGNYGSSACYDVLCLQALSKRIHYGKFVAEAKFQSQRSHYLKLIQQQDAEGILDTLTNRDVEVKVVDRVRRKAATYGQHSEEVASDNGLAENPEQQYKVSPDTIALLYDQWVMPMTKQVQVQYLLRRLDD